jgi:hypothetical protein
MKRGGYILRYMPVRQGLNARSDGGWGWGCNHCIWKAMCYIRARAAARIQCGPSSIVIIDIGSGDSLHHATRHIAAFFVKDENSDPAVVGRRYSVVTDDFFAFFKK